MMSTGRKTAMSIRSIRVSKHLGFETAVSATHFANGQPRRIFVLSPANTSGLRGGQLLADVSKSALMERLRHRGAPLGEIFSFISGLYFRGKLAYARAYNDPPQRIPGALVITPCGGLVSPD